MFFVPICLASGQVFNSHRVRFPGGLRLLRSGNLSTVALDLSRRRRIRDVGRDQQREGVYVPQGFRDHPAHRLGDP